MPLPPSKTLLSPYAAFCEKWKDGCGSEICEGSSKVFARGKIPADIVFCAEAPGQSEAVLGKPLVGPAGKLLDHIVARSVPTNVSCLYTNIVCCMPLDEGGDKISQPPIEAVKDCAPRLKELVWLAKPKLIVLVGNEARRGVSGQAQFSKAKDHSLPWIPKGKVLGFCEIVHPAYILRSNIAQRSLQVQRCIVAIQNAIEEYL